MSATSPMPRVPLAEASFWMPVQASQNAAATDHLFQFIFWLSAFFFALIMGLMILFVLKYRRRDPDQLGEGPSHNTALEVLWSVIPLGLVIAIFGISFVDFMKIVGPNAAPNAYDIGVTGQKWKWTFTYPNGYVDDALHVPVDTPMQLTLSSEDVIHSLYIPAFRIKQDAVPGRFTKMFFRATEPGEYVIFCAEYCGTSHSAMLSKVVVHRPGEYEKWLVEASNFLDKMPPADAGKKLFTQRGCASCHSVDGAAGTGPTLKGVFGSMQPLTTGQKVLADENYIRESILNPQAKVVAGFEPVMPTFQGRLKDREIGAIIEYLKTIKQ